ncbi:hypothetical protein [Haloarchaeobius amylolyticus]|uniref:hypothetical protein n=1 Tax=Haloarchaeobius amylolyticus TaxID=1198296 RepID=UPI0022700A8A|nr:hypothetical protein [Haloarchaeobius amylolyticus]
MTDSEGVVRTEFDRLPKHIHPAPTADSATVDLFAGPRQVVVLGHVRNGDSRHDLVAEDVRVERAGADRHLHVTLRIERTDAELVTTGPAVHAYRLLVEFSDTVPNEYHITHLDQNGEVQFETMEALMVPPHRVSDH